ncbi:MAG TPA: DUF6760 family protein [Chloroflexota bacterium]|jgi:hypothetical protein
MPGLRARVPAGSGAWRGGTLGYPLDRLHEEVAYIAYHFHWPLEAVLALEHADRRRWVAEIAQINRRLGGR